MRRLARRLKSLLLPLWLSALPFGASCAAENPPPSTETGGKTSGHAERNGDRLARDALMRDIERMMRQSAPETGRSALSPRVRAALEAVDRRDFVPPAQAWAAYENRPLPIGHGQTISQPFIVAIMTELLDPEPSDVVLEVGTGSGYQAAVLAKLVSHVYSIEIVAPLAAESKARLAALGYRNVTVRQGDGYAGWPEHAPFDKIIVTAAAPTIPPPLIEQLKPGGRMVIPLGAQYAHQDLVIVDKAADGTVRERRLFAVGFVPLVRPDDAAAGGRSR
ncbi:MAG TPA: protein-L-isoaspartate(D-aspartate) O-methyltransferase [Alphaproteobacteria bacterium]